MRIRERGFSLVEVMIAVAITATVMASVFLLLQRGQRSFTREPEVSDMNASARASLDRVAQDLTVAGFNTPITMPIMWFDGGGITPDEVTIVYADPEVPISRPKPCGGGGGGGGGGPCNTIGMSSVLNLDPYSFSPQPANYEEAYSDGMVLRDPGSERKSACDDSNRAILEVTQPLDARSWRQGARELRDLNINHNPGQARRRSTSQAVSTTTSSWIAPSSGSFTSCSTG
jgi:prepilin-type N-terminal cleavage/methylation domain-containing protein